MGIAYNTSIVRDGLVLHLDAANVKSYPGSGTTWSDLSGNGNNFTLFNTPNIQNGVISLDGTNEYAKRSEQIISSPNSLSVGCWMMKQNIGSGTYEVVIHHSYNQNIGQSSFFLGVETGTEQILVSIGAENAPGTWTAGRTGIIAEYDTWYHVFAVWNGSVVKKYVNGNFKGQYTLNSYPSTAVGFPVRIGASTDGTNYQFGGKCNDIMIYNNRGLSEVEIKKNFEALRGRYGI